MKHKFLAASAVLMTLVFVSGALFAGGQTAPAEPEVIKIGASVSLSGNLARFGNMVKNGYELWAEQVNAQGGIQVGDKKTEREVHVERVTQLVKYSTQMRGNNSRRK